MGVTRRRRRPGGKSDEPNGTTLHPPQPPPSPPPPSPPPPPPQQQCRHRIGVLVILALYAMIVYANGVPGEFVFDDASAIEKNNDVRPDTPLTHLFTNDFWGRPIHTGRSHKSYRPLTVLTFRWNVWAHGFRPWGFKATNVLLHAIVCLMIVFVLGDVAPSFLARILTAFFFASHPIHTEAVIGGCVGRAEMMYTLFFLASFWFYTRAAQPDTTGLLSLFISLGMATASMLCKEQGMTVLAVNLVFDLFFTVGLLERIWSNKDKDPPRSSENGKRLRIVPLVLRIITLVLWVTFLGTVRKRLTKRMHPNFHDIDNNIHFAQGIKKIYSLAHLYCRYMWLLIWPVHLSADYSFNAFPIIEGWSDPRQWASVAFYLFLLFLAIRIIQSSHARVYAFAVAITVCSFFPATGILFPVGTVLAERILYVPSLGFCFLLGEWLARMYMSTKTTRTRWLVPLFIVLLLSFYTVRTVIRNPEWADGETLFQSVVREYPTSAKAVFSLGVRQAQAGKHLEALQFFEKAVKIKPDYWHVWACIGKAYAAMNDTTTGLAYLTYSLANEEDDFTHSELADIYQKHGQVDQAGFHYERAHRMDKMNPHHKMNYANILAIQGDPTEAISLLQEIVVVAPSLSAVHRNLGVLLALNGRCSEALPHLELVESEMRGDILAQENLAQCRNASSLHL